MKLFELPIIGRYEIKPVSFKIRAEEVWQSLSQRFLQQFSEGDFKVEKELARELRVLNYLKNNNDEKRFDYVAKIIKHKLDQQQLTLRLDCHSRFTPSQ